MKKNDEGMSLYEIISDYTVLSEEIIDGFKIAKLRTHDGVMVTCRTPVHTPEETQKIREDICEALIQFAYPNLDLSQVEHMKVII